MGCGSTKFAKREGKVSTRDGNTVTGIAAGCPSRDEGHPERNTISALTNIRSSGMSRIRVTLSEDGSMLEVETENMDRSDGAQDEESDALSAGDGAPVPSTSAAGFEIESNLAHADSFVDKRHIERVYCSKAIHASLQDIKKYKEYAPNITQVPKLNKMWLPRERESMDCVISRLSAKDTNKQNAATTFGGSEQEGSGVYIKRERPTADSDSDSGNELQSEQCNGSPQLETRGRDPGHLCERPCPATIMNECGDPVNQNMNCTARELRNLSAHGRSAGCDNAGKQHSKNHKIVANANLGTVGKTASTSYNTQTFTKPQLPHSQHSKLSGPMIGDKKNRPKNSPYSNKNDEPSCEINTENIAHSLYTVGAKTDVDGEAVAMATRECGSPADDGFRDDPIFDLAEMNCSDLHVHEDFYNDFGDNFDDDDDIDH